MKVAFTLVAVAISVSCFSQTLSKEEQSKVNGLIKVIKSEVQLSDTTPPKTNSCNYVRFRITPGNIDSSKLPLIIIDGVLHEYGALQAIDPNAIETVSVLKSDKASFLFCNRPPRDIIVITLKCKISPAL